MGMDKETFKSELRSLAYAAAFFTVMFLIAFAAISLGLVLASIIKADILTNQM